MRVLEYVCNETEAGPCLAVYGMLHAMHHCCPYRSPSHKIDTGLKTQCPVGKRVRLLHCDKQLHVMQSLRWPAKLGLVT